MAQLALTRLLQPLLGIKAYNENDKVIARVVTEPIAVFSLANRPEPAVYVADGKLIVENKELLDTETVKSNLGLNGVLLEAEVYFYKDGATTPTYTAKGSYIDTYPTADLPLSITEKKIKNNIAGSYYTWKWDGAATATTALPAFEKGTYTIKYKAGYYPVINASYRYKNGETDGIVVTDPSDILAEMQYREGEVKDFKLVIAEATTPEAVAEGYQGAKVTWPAVEGAASYQVFVGATKVADATTNEATVTGLKDANKYKFIVKSLDANGNVIATSVESNEVTVWTLLGVREPVITFDGTTLLVDKAYDLGGVIMEITVDFVGSDGNIAHTAYYTKNTDAYNPTGNITNNGENGGRFTATYWSQYLDAGKKWTWDGVENSDAPAFNVGEYTINYTAQYYTIVGGYWSVSSEYDTTKYTEATGNRIHFPVGAVLQTYAERKGTLAEKYVVGMNPKVEIAGLYQAAKITWSPVAGASSYTVAYGTTEACTDGSVNATETTATIENLNAARNYYFKVTGGSETATVSAELFTLCDYDPSFEIVKQDDGSWKFNMYRLAYEGGIFRSIAFTLKEKGSDTVLYSENGTSGEVGFIADASHWGWASHYYTPWTKQTDSNWSTAAGKKLAGIEFKPGTTYVIEYTAALTPGITAWEKADYAGDYTWSLEQMQAGTHFYYAALLIRKDNVPTTTGTMEFTTAQ